MKKLLFIFILMLSVALFSGCKKTDTSIDIANNEDLMETVQEANKLFEKTVPENLNKCTLEMFNIVSCDNEPDDYVCGYDHTVYEDGREKDHAITYRNSCVYCQMFNSKGTMIMGTVTSLGYVNGECE